jgi:hypothetical protein
VWLLDSCGKCFGAGCTLTMARLNGMNLKLVPVLPALLGAEHGANS